MNQQNKTPKILEEIDCIAGQQMIGFKKMWDAAMPKFNYSGYWPIIYGTGGETMDDAEFYKYAEKPFISNQNII